MKMRLDEVKKEGSLTINEEVSRVTALFNKFKKTGLPLYEWPGFLRSMDRYSYPKRRMLRIAKVEDSQEGEKNENSYCKNSRLL